MATHDLITIPHLLTELAKGIFNVVLYQLIQLDLSAYDYFAFYASRQGQLIDKHILLSIYSENS